MRGADLVTPEKTFSSLMRSRFEAERVIENPKQGPAGLQSGSEGGRYRKGQNEQKKQPQRGLGVAQLEKIRLQEQSKHEAACLASLHYFRGMPYASFSPCVTLADHREALRFSSPLEEQFRTGSLIHAVGQQVEDRKAFGVLGSTGSGSGKKAADGKARGYEFGNVLMPFPANPSIILPYFRDNPNTTCTQQTKSEMEVIYDLQTDNLSPNVLWKNKAGGCVSSIKYPQTGGIHLSGHYLNKLKEGRLHKLGIFDSSEPPGLHTSPKQSFTNNMLATSGISSVGERPTELSSFQNFLGNQIWSDEDKMSALKRKWLSMQENPALLAKFLDSSAGIEVSDSKREKFNSFKNLHTPEMLTAGAHYSTGIVRDALGSPWSSQTKVKYDTAASDWLEALSRFQNSKGSSNDNYSPPSDILHFHVMDGDSSKSSLTTRFLAEDAAFNVEASSGEFLALKLPIPYSISEKTREFVSPENAWADMELNLKRDFTSSSPRNSITGAQGDFLLTAKLFKKESTDYADACSWNLSADEQIHMSIHSEQLPSQDSPCQQPTSPHNNFENSSMTSPAASSLKSIDLSLKLAL